MKKHTLYRAALLPLITATLIACAWWSLHDDRALILRDQPLLQLSEAQKQAIRDLPGDITLEAYVRNNPRQRRGFADLVAPYKQIQPRLHLEFINPDSDPLRVQERDITREGQLYLTDGTHGERIDIASPQSLASALLNLGETTDSQILHLQGHGERAWRQDSSGNWRAAYERIQNAKTSIGDQDQNRERDIPRSVNLLVIADPETIPQEHGSALQTYLARGGSLLYSTDTRHPYLPPWLASLTGLKLVEGSIVDAGAKNYGLDDPQMLIIDTLGNDRVSDGISQAPLLPTAVAFTEDPEHPPTSDWKRSVLLWTNNKSWAEHSPDAANLIPDADEAKGPLALAWLLERDYQGKPQRIILIGDSDIFHDSYLNIGGNSTLVQNLFARLLPDNAHGNIAPPELKDQYLNLPAGEQLPLATILIVVLPLLPLLVGVLLAWRRKRKYGMVRS